MIKKSRRYLPWVATIVILFTGAAVATPLAMCAFRSNDKPFVEIFFDHLVINIKSTESHVGDFYLSNTTETPDIKLLRTDDTELKTISCVANLIDQELGKYSIDLKSSGEIIKTEVKIGVYVTGQLRGESKLFFITVFEQTGSIAINGSTNVSALVGTKVSNIATLTFVNLLSDNVVVSLVDDKNISIAGSTCELTPKTTNTTAEYYVSITCTELLTNKKCKIFVSYNSEQLCESVELDVTFFEQTGSIALNGSSTISDIVGTKVSNIATLTLVNLLSDNVVVLLVDDKNISIAGSTCELTPKTTNTTAEYYVSITCTELLTNKKCKIFVSYNSEQLCESVELDVTFFEDPDSAYYKVLPEDITIEDRGTNEHDQYLSRIKGIADKSERNPVFLASKDICLNMLFDLYPGYATPAEDKYKLKNCFDNVKIGKNISSKGKWNKSLAFRDNESAIEVLDYLKLNSLVIEDPCEDVTKETLRLYTNGLKYIKNVTFDLPLNKINVDSGQYPFKDNTILEKIYYKKVDGVTANDWATKMHLTDVSIFVELP